MPTKRPPRRLPGKIACRDSGIRRAHAKIARCRHPRAPGRRKKTKASGAASAPAARKGPPVATAQQIADLAWAGQHAKAIELATAALAASGLEAAAPARPPRPACGKLHCPRRPRTRRRGRRRDARSREDRQDGRCDGAGAESPGAGANAQGELKAADRHGDRRPQGRAPEQADSRSLRSACCVWPKRSFEGTPNEEALAERDRGGRAVPGAGRCVRARAGAVGSRLGARQPRTCRRIQPVGERCAGALPELR